MKTYRVEFNDFGNCYVIALDFTECERIFMDSGYGGLDVKINSIVHVSESNEPLTRK